MTLYNEEQLYCITYYGTHCKFYSYTKQPNIKALAIYLNKCKERYPEPVIEVRATDSYDSMKGVNVFFPSEYHSQHFLETYEERLLEQHRIEELLV